MIHLSNTINSSLGDYSTEAYNPQTNGYARDSNLGITITVEEIFDNDHRIVNQRGGSKGRFTFTAADSGDHRICFNPNNGPSGGWLSGGVPSGQGIRFTLDMAIGETSMIESTDKTKVADLESKVRDLNARLQDIKREQVFQRVSYGATNCIFFFNRLMILQEREAEFRDLSESVNNRVVRWTMFQLVVLGVTCAWQLTHLRSFFIKQKLT